MALTNVSFRRADNEPWLLKDINLTLNPGECVSLSSDNAPALSALLDMIAGVYAAKTGNIRIDGQNVLQYTSKDLINHVGYVQPEGMIFRGTIRDNLTCFGQIAEDKVQEMAALFQVDTDIASLPSGFDTFLNGNSTDTIPPGLKQRISMVRVLAPKPRLILFDNADRSLDRSGYNLVYNLLARLKGKATIILSSDDQNLTAQASRFYVLSGGRLVEQSPQSDSRKNVQYRELKL